MSLILTALSFIPFYLLGAIPVGTIIAGRSGVQITAHGSGNVGATNVARVIGKKAGLLTLLLDIVKGASAVLLAMLIASDARFHSAAGVAAVAGHCFSIPTKLRGGKGVATGLGVYLTLAPTAALIGIISFALVYLATKIVSLASVVAAAIIPIFALLTATEDPVALGMAIISLIVIFRHRTNLARLVTGTEKRFSTAQSDGGSDQEPSTSSSASGPK